MGSNSLRKIKEVNGWKINHPHSAANIFYIIFTLLLVATPLAFLFLPSVTLVDNILQTNSSFNGIDLIKMSIELLKYLINEGGTKTSNDCLNALLNADVVGANIASMAPYFLLTLAGCLGLIVVFSLVLFILFLVNLLKGYLNHSGAVKVFSVINFFLSLAYSSFVLVFFFGFKGTAVCISGVYTMHWYWPIIIASGYLVFIIIIAIIYSASFKDSIPESQLEFHDDTPTVEHVTKVHQVNVAKFTGSSTLPKNLTSIGGHDYAENQSLVVADIPSAVSKIGTGAFANCLNLKVVTLPNGIREIGSNCFFNCVSLERINFNGTKQEWKKVARGSNWLLKAKTNSVVCTDGAITVNIYH